MSTDRNTGNLPPQASGKDPGPSPTAPRTRRARALLSGVLANLGGRALWECLKWVVVQLLG
ncbi:hypothetical protein [Rhodococcus opacus]|uniref:hypothetical protein n=1 Tax=Rhodococcus opacus TaxID=37919 RepID=UPI002472FE46|nr:hypothetical protein [Rhodococcus opacus]MDH6293151.1 hypothetical protein [Rhodococcus opacus]